MQVMIKSLLLGILMLFTATAAFGGGEPDLSVVPRATPDYVQANLGNPDVLLIDVRRFEDMIPPEKIPGALVKDWERTKQWAKELPRGKEIITYCAWPDEYTSASVALYLSELGFTNTKAMQGGWDAWKAKGYPVVKTGPEDM